MTVWLVDASVLLAREDTDDAHHREACRLLGGEDPLSTVDLAYYEVTNVAIRAWRDPAAATRLRGVVAAIARDRGLVRADESLLAAAAEIAEATGLSAYDAAYAAAAAATGARLVSCDIRDLVARGLAVTPADAR